MSLVSWQQVHDEVERRIHSRAWKPGDPIPRESDLAAEFGCARTTVNRALRALAEAGLLERRRRAGTRVAAHPERRAVLDIPVLRLEIEARGQAPGYRLLERRREEPPPGPMPGRPVLRVLSLHTADDLPFAFEDRWIDPAVVPSVLEADLSAISANEWLLLHAPFTRGEASYAAEPASAPEARALGCRPGDPVFVMERTTWDGEGAITAVRQVFAPGHRMQVAL